MEFEALANVSKNLNVLYVEDDEDTLVQTSKMLQNYFKSIDTASNGEDGYDKFYSHKYDIIFTDISMPHLDGLDMIAKIKEQNQDIPIAIFSAHDDSECFLKSIELGIDGYLLKPYNVKQLNTLIEKLVSKNHTSKPILKLENDLIWDSTEKTILNSITKECYKLTSKEILLIEYLASHQNSVVKLEDIQEHIYDDFIESTKRIRNLISRLKAKLEFDIIESIYGYGYRLKTCGDIEN